MREDKLQWLRYTRRLSGRAHDLRPAGLQEREREVVWCVIERGSSQSPASDSDKRVI